MSELAEFIHVVLPPVSMSSLISCGGVGTFALTWKPAMGTGRAYRVVLNHSERGGPEPDRETDCQTHCGVSDCQKVLDNGGDLEDDDHGGFGQADEPFCASPSRGSCLWSKSLIP